jgi:hypothetical protein
MLVTISMPSLARLIAMISCLVLSINVTPYSKIAKTHVNHTLNKIIPIIISKSVNHFFVVNGCWFLIIMFENRQKNTTTIIIIH